MEFVNVNSLRLDHTLVPGEGVRFNQRYSHVGEDHVLTTDKLELIRGHEAVKRARLQLEPWLPLVRVTKEANRDDLPTRVVLELTNHCNSNCTMCPRNAMTRPLTHMDTRLAKRLIDEVSEEGVNALWLFNIGESLLHPDFFEILEHCRTKEIDGTLWLSSNGQNLDSPTRVKILDFPVDILNISVNAMSEEAYAKVSPKLDFHTIRHNILSFVSEKQRSGRARPLVRVQMVEVPHVVDEIEAFKREYADKADILSINKLEVFSQNVDSLSNTSAVVKNAKIARCNRLERNDFFVMADGRITCCATDFNGEHDLGNAADGSIKEIFTGDKYERLMTAYEGGSLHELEICSTCRDYNL